MWNFKCEYRRSYSSDKNTVLQICPICTIMILSWFWFHSYLEFCILSFSFTTHISLFMWLIEKCDGLSVESAYPGFNSKEMLIDTGIIYKYSWSNSLNFQKELLHFWSNAEFYIIDGISEQSFNPNKKKIEKFAIFSDRTKFYLSH